MRWVYENFPHVYVSFSGGKDSTVVLNLAREAATEMGRLPVNVMWIDQEGEWLSVVEYQKSVMYADWVKPFWLQVPIRMTNNTSTTEEWILCWDPAQREKWLHPHDPISIKQNVYGVDRFHAMFSAFLNYHHFTETACSIGGVRCEESPGRTLALTLSETTKGVTWGSGNQNAKHFTLYPIYDWTYRDVWRAIHEHHWPYCSLYDSMYQYGVPLRHMRVSNVHHEMAMTSLLHMQEIEPEMWERLTARLGGINSCAQLGDGFYMPRSVPWMFADWREYRDHLLANLIVNPEAKAYFRNTFERMDSHYEGEYLDILYRYEVSALTLNDTHGVALGAYTSIYGQHDIGRKERHAADTGSNATAE